MNKYLVIALLVLASCKKNNDVTSNGGSVTDTSSRSTGQFYEYNILPSTTNSSIVLFNSAHAVCLDTRTTLKNKLFVFLPGTTGFPATYKLIVKQAASQGYHAIGLMYPNDASIYTASNNDTTNTQFAKCRQEIFDGTNQTSGVSVDTNNCIKSRLYKLLLYLQRTYPTQNWSQYILNGQVNWSKIVVAGHSQGGGHSFFIAKKVAVDKAISFSSIDWNSALNRSAAWVTQTGATPINKFYSFNGTRDEVFSYTNVQTQLADMGITGSPVSIDNNNSPYSSTHRLTTSATPALSIAPFPNHNLTCLDMSVPKTSSGTITTAFINAWIYLLNN
jgi:hypothetical protein